MSSARPHCWTVSRAHERCRSSKAVLFAPGPSYNRVTVPLSDHEQRILDEIEKNLYQEDPGFARQVKKRGPEKDGGRVKLGAAIFAAGFLGLFLFFASGVVAIGVLAFAGMVLGIVLIAGSMRSLFSSSSASREPGDRISRALTDWEKRVRQRYKKD